MKLVPTEICVNSSCVTVPCITRQVNGGSLASGIYRKTREEIRMVPVFMPRGRNIIESSYVIQQRYRWLHMGTFINTCALTWVIVCTRVPCSVSLGRAWVNDKWIDGENRYTRCAEQFRVIHVALLLSGQPVLLRGLGSRVQCGIRTKKKR